jgi:hypothetical protein
MTTLIHADVFFFVATIALVVVSVLMAIALIYAIIIVRKFKITIDRIERFVGIIRSIVGR